MADLFEDSADGYGHVAYQAVASRLREAIGRGDFAGGRRLPTEAELGFRWRVSRHTIRRAIQELVGEGLVFRVRGSGTYATAMPDHIRYLRSFGTIEDLLALSVDTTMEVIEPLERRSHIAAAGRLKLASDQVMAVVIRRFHEQLPFCVSEIFLPLDVGRLVAESAALPAVGEPSSRTVISVVDELGAGAVVGAHQSITACPLPAEHAERVDCRPAEPVLRVDRLYFDAAGRGVELAVSHFNPHRYSYRLELRRRVGTSASSRKP